MMKERVNELRKEGEKEKQFEQATKLKGMLSVERENAQGAHTSVSNKRIAISTMERMMKHLNK